MKIASRVIPWEAYRALSHERTVGVQLFIELGKTSRRDDDPEYITAWKFSNFTNDPSRACPVEYMTEITAFEMIFAYQAQGVFRKLSNQAGGHYLLSYQDLIDDTYRRMKANRRTWQIGEISDLARAFTWMFEALAKDAMNEATGRTRSVRTDAKTGKRIYFDRAYTWSPPRTSGAPQPALAIEQREVRALDGALVSFPAKLYPPLPPKPRPDYIVRTNNSLGAENITATEVTNHEKATSFTAYELTDNANDHEELFIVNMGKARATIVIQLLVTRLQSVNDLAHPDVLEICLAVLGNDELIRVTPSGCGWRRKLIAKELNWDLERVDRALDFFRSRTGGPSPVQRLIGATSFDEAVHPALPRNENPGE